MIPKFANGNDPVIYQVTPDPVAAENAVIAHAMLILARRVNTADVLSSPQTVKDFLTLRFSGLDHEVFSVLFLDSQNRLIELVEMFRGTLTQTSVYPREIVKLVLFHNAASVILVHNHPSSDPTPSRADENLTQTLKSALALVDCRILDHIIVGGSTAMSMAEKGLV